MPHSAALGSTAGSDSFFGFRASAFGLPDVCLPDMQGRFEARVREQGGDEREYIREVLERDLRAGAPNAGMTLAELMSLASGASPADQMSEEELAEFAEREVRAYRAEKRAGAKRA